MTNKDITTRPPITAECSKIIYERMKNTGIDHAIIHQIVDYAWDFFSEDKKRVIDESRPIS